MLAISQAQNKEQKAIVVRAASLALRRSVITLVACMSNDGDVQKLLPHVIIGIQRVLL